MEEIAMKKMSLAIVSLFVVIMMISCDATPSGGGGGDVSGGVEPSDKEPEGEYIWTAGSKLYIVTSSVEFADEMYADKYGTLASNIFYTIAGYSDATIGVSNDSDAVNKHEVVIGRAEREISKTAYRLLEESGAEDPKNDVVVRYLVYSDGSSLAVAYTNHEENVAIDAVSEYFLNDIAANSSLVLEEGIVKQKSFSMNEIHQKRDDDLVKEQWDALEERIVESMSETMSTADAQAYAAEMVYELKSLYSMYTDDLIAWFAGLYEPYICICDGECQNTKYCGGAGFYYSNSARDNVYTVREGVEYLLLPDAETTAQVIGFLKHSGMLKLVGNDYYQVFPEGEPERIIRFIKALQDEETGYFYHPQWLSMLGTASYWDSRQSRDLTYSISVLSAFGAKPTYDTPTGVVGDGILYDGTDLNISVSAASLTLPLAVGSASAVSRVVATGSVHPNLASEEAFKNYLAGYDATIGSNSYYIGNELSSLSSQIVARDREVGTEEDPTPYADILVEWLGKHQDAETGHWHKVATDNDYYPTNGLLKIATIYNTLGKPFPNALNAARYAFEVITSEQPINHVCDLYNTWFIISQITQNLKSYSDNSELAKQIINEVRVDAIEAVKVTAEKMITHQKEDGSFSYYKDHSSFTSQNAPVAINGTNEGDVNATVIFTYGIVQYLFDSLDFGSKVQMFTDRDREVFIELIEERIANCEMRQNEN